MKYSTYYFLYLILLAACSTEEKEKTFYTFQVSESAESRELKLSELMEVENVTPLETSPESLLPAWFGYWATDDYIITVPMNYSNDTRKIQQFSRDGKFIRTLISEGGGPSEYKTLQSFTINPSQNILYFSHSGNLNEITAIDLTTGAHLPGIKIPQEELKLEKGYVFSALIMKDDTTFVGSPQGSLGTILFAPIYFSTTGHFLGGIPVPSVENSETGTPRIRMLTSMSYLRNVSGETHFYTSDTLYSMKGTNKFPVSAITVEDPFDQTKMKGNSASIICETSRFILYKTNYTEVKITETSASLNSEKAKCYLLNKDDGTTVQISDVLIDNLGLTVEPDQLDQIRIADNRMILKINADQFKTLAEEVLDNGKASAEIMSRLKELDDNLAIEDNPLLIIGKVK